MSNAFLLQNSAGNFYKIVLINEVTKRASVIWCDGYYRTVKLSDYFLDFNPKKVFSFEDILEFFYKMYTQHKFKKYSKKNRGRSFIVREILKTFLNDECKNNS